MGLVKFHDGWFKQLLVHFVLKAGASASEAKIAPFLRITPQPRKTP